MVQTSVQHGGASRFILDCVARAVFACRHFTSVSRPFKQATAQHTRASPRRMRGDLLWIEQLADCFRDLLSATHLCVPCMAREFASAVAQLLLRSSRSATFGGVHARCKYHFRRGHYSALTCFVPNLSNHDGAARGRESASTSGESAVHVHDRNTGNGYRRERSGNPWSHSPRATLRNAASGRSRDS